MKIYSPGMFITSILDQSMWNPEYTSLDNFLVKKGLTGG